MRSSRLVSARTLYGTRLLSNDARRSALRCYGLGHASLSTSYAHYRNVSAQRHKEAAEQIESLLTREPPIRTVGPLSPQAANS